jgi:hypothetical protein
MMHVIALDRPARDLSNLRNHLGGSGSMAETRRWLRSGGNSSDSLAKDSYYVSDLKQSESSTPGITCVVHVDGTICWIRIVSPI